MTQSTSKAIRIVTILGTTRPGNFTSKALALVNDELSSNPNVHLETIDPANLTLGFPGQVEDDADAKRLQESVSNAAGVIFATPEYHGTFSAMTKLIIENLGFPSALSGKPVALLGVAGGQIGAIKSLEQLRGVCSHTGAIVLPGAVSVPGVNRVFDDSGACTDPKVEKRIRRVATSLMDYIGTHVCPRLNLEAMVRDSGASE